MDEPDFTEIVETHYSNLFRFALVLSKNENDAGDLVQQTFSIYLRKWRQLRDASKVKTWLFTTLRREFLGDLRKNRHIDSEELVEETAADPTLETIETSELDSETVLSALSELPQDYREPLTLFYLKEYSYSEIGEILEIPTGTVMSRLSRGKTRLRKILSRG